MLIEIWFRFKAQRNYEYNDSHREARLLVIRIHVGELDMLRACMCVCVSVCVFNYELTPADHKYHTCTEGNMHR